jgi:hypothetical protein
MGRDDSIQGGSPAIKPFILDLNRDSKLRERLSVSVREGAVTHSACEIALIACEIKDLPRVLADMTRCRYIAYLLNYIHLGRILLPARITGSNALTAFIRQISIKHTLAEVAKILRVPPRSRIVHDYRLGVA